MKNAKAPFHIWSWLGQVSRLPRFDDFEPAPHTEEFFSLNTRHGRYLQEEGWWNSEALFDMWPQALRGGRTKMYRPPNPSSPDK